MDHKSIPRMKHTHIPWMENNDISSMENILTPQLKHNLSLSWWKYDKRKRRHCFMWLGFVLFLVVVIVAMVVFISSLTGGSEPYTSKMKSFEYQLKIFMNIRL